MSTTTIQKFMPKIKMLPLERLQISAKSKEVKDTRV